MASFFFTGIGDDNANDHRSLRQNIQQFHRDHVPTVPTQPFPFHCLGSTELCANQGMVLFYDLPNGPDTDDHKSVLRKIHIFTTQGHPEFHAAIMSKLVENRERRGILSHAVAADAWARNELEVDGSVGKEGGWVNDGLEVGGIIWGMLGL